MALASLKIVLVASFFIHTSALQNRNAHRTVGQAATVVRRHSLHLDGTVAGGAHRSVSGQANIFTDVLDKFGWTSPSTPANSTFDAASVSTRAGVDSTSEIVTRNGDSNHSLAFKGAGTADGAPTGHPAEMKVTEKSEVEAHANRASDGMSEMTAAGEGSGDASWKEGLTGGAAFSRTTRTCMPGQQYCKSLCRWLKLTDKDFDGATIDRGSCPLFDWSMESSGYTAPSSRKHSSPEPVDCATSYLHQNVQRKDVRAYVLQLEECMVGLPQEDSEKYGAPLEVVATEIAGWKKEQSVREGAALIELRIQEAVEQGRKAYFTKVGVADAVGNLTSVMRKAQSVDTGHYMFNDIRTGRELLEKLQPIVLVQKGLANSEAHGQAALEHKLAEEVNSAIVLLNVTIASAEALGVEEQAKSAKHVRDELTSMQTLMSQIHVAFLQANVSVRTKLHTEEAIEKMNKTLAKAKAARIVAPLPSGHRLIAELTEIAEAKDELKVATKNARAALEDDGHGQEAASFLDAMHALQDALARASQLRLTSHVTSDAVRLMASLQESKAARQALRTATLHANAVALDPSSLNFTSEDVAIGELSGAVSWAEHAHLQHSMPTAKELLKMLSVLRDAKMRMTNAISVGDASLQATAGQENAIAVLSKSMREAKALNMTAGTFRVKEQLKKLRRQVDARDGLERAVARAGRKLRAKKIRPSALRDLNASITQAADSGLKDEVVLAQKQLERLHVLKDALDDINVAIRLNPPERAAAQLFSVSDPEPSVKVAVPELVTELKTTDLPEVPGSHDDGDADFAEHILRLNRSIANAKHFSLVDPEMLEQVAQLQKFQVAWDMLNASTQEGRSALEKKVGLYKATVHVEDAIRLAQGVGLKVGVKKAKHLVSELQTLPDVKNELDAATLEGKLALKFKLGIHDALVRLNAALDESKRFGLMGKEKKAEKLRSTLLSVNEAWLQLRAATVQGAVALRLEHGEDAAIDVLQSAISKASSAGLSSETPGAAQLLSELRHMNEAHQSIESAVVPGEV